MAEFKFRVLTSQDWAAADALKTGLNSDEDGLKLDLASQATEGWYRPKPLSGSIAEHPYRWHRIVIDADIPNNNYIEIKAFTSDDPNFDDPAPQVYVFKDEVRDILIQVPPGRYIMLRIGFHGDSKKTPVLRQVKIYYPRLSYLRYLPAIYQDDEDSRDFLERFLSVFESMLYESDEIITNIPIYFDPMAAPADFLRWLASWLALDRYDLLDEAQNREFILRAMEFYRQKGTASGLASLITFLTGRECCVKEYMNNVFRTYGREHKEAAEETSGGCINAFHSCSKTVDTDPKKGLISEIGKYKDRLHYTFDSSPDGKYSPHEVGLFIFRKPGERLSLSEDQLKKIINAFLPVFIHIDINEVESFEEAYPPSKNISDSYSDQVQINSEDVFSAVGGSFTDVTSFLYLKTWLKTNAVGTTNNIDYRTFHSGLRKPIAI